MADEGFTAEELVQGCNKIIVYAGLIARVANIEEVRVACSSSSLLVAALEGFLGRRLDNVLRMPSTPVDRAYNITVVVDVLSHVLSCDLSHISGQRIVEGSIEDISNILELLSALCQGKPLQGPPPATDPYEAARQVSNTNRTGPVQDGLTFSLHASDGPEQRAQGSLAAATRQVPEADGSPPLWPPNSTEAGGHATEDDYYYDNDESSAGRSQLGQDSELASDEETAEHRHPLYLRQQQGEQSDDQAAPQYDAYPQQQQYGEAGSDYEQDPHGRLEQSREAGSDASPAAAGVRVRRRGAGRRQRTSLHRAVVTGQHHVPLSPIQEVSREGWETSRASKEALSGFLQASVNAGSGSPATARASPPSLHPHGAETRRSAGGASSIISVPSLPQDDLRRSSSSPDSGARMRQVRQQEQPVGDLAAEPHPNTVPPSSYSEGTSTLLERALSQAEATLRGLGRQYEDFYYEEEDAEEAELAASSRRRARKRHTSSRRQQHPHPRPPPSTHGASTAGQSGGGIVRGGGPPAYEPARRTHRAAPWPGGQSGRVQQHQAFLSRAKRVLAVDGAAAATSTTTSTSLGVPPTSASGSGRRSGSGSGPSSAGLPPRSAARRSATVEGAYVGGSEAAAAGRRARRQWSTREGAGGGGHAALVRALREGVAPAGEAAVADATARGRKLLQRAPEPLQDGLDESYGDADARMGLAPKPRPSLQLNPELEGKLRYLYRLAGGDPKQRAARATVQSLAVADDLLRHSRRRALVERLSSARARREESKRMATERLREQGQEYEKRVEQLRLQRVASEWAASQRSAQMRRAVAAEVALRDTFVEVLESEKEVLLAARQEAKANANAAFPTYKRAMRKAEQDYGEVFELLEGLLASERQQRVAADRETLTAQRHYNQLSASVVRDRVQELLGRVAREDAAAAARYGIATQPKARRALMARLRRLIALSGVESLVV